MYRVPHLLYNNIYNRSFKYMNLKSILLLIVIDNCLLVLAKSLTKLIFLTGLPFYCLQFNS